MCKYSKKISLILFLSIFFNGLIVYAQTPQDILNDIQNNIQVIVNPQFPKAGEAVSIHLQSYSTPLDQANISWIIGEKVMDKGLGMTDFSFTAGGIGSKTTVTTKIITTNGSIVNREIVIQPANIDLLWQASSYVPPFYEGKALFPHQGLITFTAIPNISEKKSLTSSISSYVYTWRKDNDVLGQFSGYGKNTFILRGSIISHPFTIKVDVSSTDGTTLGSASATVSPRSPEVAFYEKNPLLGILFNASLSSYTMKNKEFSISAAPFYMNTSVEPVNLEYKWTVNGQPIPTQTDPATLTVRNAEGTSGVSTIGLQVSNILKTLQFGSNSISVTFGQNSKTNL